MTDGNTGMGLFRGIIAKLSFCSGARTRGLSPSGKPAAGGTPCLTSTSSSIHSVSKKDCETCIAGEQLPSSGNLVRSYDSGCRPIRRWTARQSRKRTSLMGKTALAYPLSSMTRLGACGSRRQSFFDGGACKTTLARPSWPISSPGLSISGTKRCVMFAFSRIGFLCPRFRWLKGEDCKVVQSQV
ncbi:hypothetical protein CLAIMM_12538 isoform 2 [Cladophialophora immunda]|nr:hypothetical protein CLAIMM_12538 isoform 2 [Cladophialophora immunda]